jgi:phosphoglycerol transferase MdoB-like AlkP superfamily enzyme
MKIPTYISRSVYVSALYNLLLSMGMLMVCRLIFWLVNRNMFPDLEAAQIPSIFAGGLRFDLSAAAYGNALWLLLLLLPCRFRYNACYQSVCKWVFVVLNAILLAPNCLDFVYFRYTLRRTTAGFFNEFANEHLGGLIVQSVVDFWWVYLLWLAMGAALVILYRKSSRTTFPRGILSNVGYYLGSTAALVLTVALCVAAMRGGFKHSTRPITLSNAGQYVKRPLEMTIVQNTPHSILRTIGKKRRTLLNYFNDDHDLEQHYNPYILPHPQGKFTPKNVVVIIWESFAKEYVGALNRDIDGYVGYTPFIDSLLQHSLTFTRSYANGRKSIDGLPSVVASIPSVDNPFVLSPYSGNSVNSLGSLLGAEGYTTAFFHGAPNGSMGFWSFLKLAGFNHYYGKDEYCERYREDGGLWGIWDEEFLQFFAEKLNEMPQPFCAAVFTLSSHHPYTLPRRYAGRWQEGPHPITKCISYSDYALRQFFAAASTQDWYANTLFVITADHSNHPLHEHYATSVGQMSIPVIYFAPDGSLSGIRNAVTQQTDIMPTLLSILNYDKPYIAFGADALDTAVRINPVINYISGVYQVFYDKYVMLHDGERPLGLYDLDSDRLLKNNMLAQDTTQIVRKLELNLKAFVQQYNNRMVENRMMP